MFSCVPLQLSLGVGGTWTQRDATPIFSHISEMSRPNVKIQISEILRRLVFV